jgi:hypothetical protein
VSEQTEQREQQKMGFDQALFIRRAGDSSQYLPLPSSEPDMS